MNKKLRTQAIAVSEHWGVTRAVPITAFDRIGVPVWTTVRPRSAVLVVNGGKGLTDPDAEISARMECLEQIAAEQPAEPTHCTVMSMRDAVQQDSLMADFDRVSVLGDVLDWTAPTHWVQVDDLMRERQSFAPAELIYFPAQPTLKIGLGITTTRGLGCGSSYESATAHALLEVVERHATSLALLGLLSTSRVDLRTTQGSLHGLIAAIGRASLDLSLRVAALGDFWFATSLLFDPCAPELKFCNGGHALALDPMRAATASVLEAIQSRATYIHGAREDLPHKVPGKGFGHQGPDSMSDDAIARKLILRYQQGKPEPFPTPGPGSLSQGLEAILRAIAGIGFDSACCYRFPHDFGPLTVVRAVIPGAEDFTSDAPYLGRRLICEARRFACRDVRGVK